MKFWTLKSISGFEADGVNGSTEHSPSIGSLEGFLFIHKGYCSILHGR